MLILILFKTGINNLVIFFRRKSKGSVWQNLKLSMLGSKQYAHVIQLEKYIDGKNDV